jgi:hypothetical protein
VAFYAGHLEQRSGGSSLYAAQAMEAAEAGVAVVLGEWESFPQLGALAVDESVTLPATALGERATFQVAVLRLTGSLCLIRSQGTRTDAAGNVLAQRVVATLVRAVGSTAAPLMQRSWVQLY